MADGDRNAPGPAADAAGNPVFDPSKNVLDLVQAAMRRQDDLLAANKELAAVQIQRLDDLRILEAAHVREVSSLGSRHTQETASLRAEYQAELRAAETGRIDAIRAVDVGAVQRAAEVSAATAATLATQVATSAETLRTQAAATAASQTAALGIALEPLQKAIDELRRTQYEQQGARAEPSPQQRDIEELKRLVYDSIQARTTTTEVKQKAGVTQQQVLAYLGAAVAVVLLYLQLRGK